MTATVSIIVAHDDNLGIGRNNQLLWHISDDLKRFKKLTLNHPIIMGRKTYESIGRPLPGRTNIVITRNKELKIEGCRITNSLDEAIKLAKEEDNEEIFIIGGGEIYKQALPLTDKLYITKVEGNYNADVFFPDYLQEFTKAIDKETHQDLKHTFSYITLTK